MIFSCVEKLLCFFLFKTPFLRIIIRLTHLELEDRSVKDSGNSSSRCGGLGINSAPPTVVVSDIRYDF